MMQIGGGTPQARNTAATLARVDDLTCCRAVFAAWVFLYHLRLQLGAGCLGGIEPLVRRGSLGVDAFFVLSGLVLALAHPAIGLTAGEAGEFWWRRLLRIYPVHLAMTSLLVAGLLVAHAAGLGLRDPGRLGWDELGRHLLLLHGWGFSARWAWNYPSWSISAEWAGYLAFPPLWFALRRVPAALCVALAVAMFAMLAEVDAAAGPVGLNLTYEGALWRFFPEFIAGMIAMRLTGLLRGAVEGYCLVALGASVAGLAIGAGARDWLVVCGLWLALLGLLVAAQQGRKPLLAWLPGMVWLGTISYSFYMSFAVIETAQALAWRRLGLLPPEHVLLYAVSTTALTLALATITWRWVEQPARHLGRARRQRWRSVRWPVPRALPAGGQSR